MIYEKAGIYNAFSTSDYKYAELSSDKTSYNIKYKGKIALPISLFILIPIDLNFIHEGIMNDKIRVYGANNVAHCFSRSMKFPEWLKGFDRRTARDFTINKYNYTDFLLGSNRPGHVRDRQFSHLPMPIHFVIKHRNQGKIESHKWFFSGFCEKMNPTYAQILDWGSICSWNSLSYIVRFWDKHKNIGAWTGELEVLIPERHPETNKEFTISESMLLRAQYWEYKISNYFDKQMESFFGFVSVLPGAFSSFRWKCINGKPLQEFLKGSKDEFGMLNKLQSCYTANKFLAEDRIMPLEILAWDGNWTVSYVAGAKCLTDPPLSLIGLIKQRRRWFNGSLFATLHVMSNPGKVTCRNWWCKSFWRNLYFLVLYVYMVFINILSFVLVGAYYATFSIFARAVLPSSDDPNIFKVANVIENVYLVFLFLVIILSTSIRLEWAIAAFWVSSIFMGIFSIIMVVWSFIFAFRDTSNYAIIGIFSYLLVVILPIILNMKHIKIWDFLKGWVYLLYLTPTYINILSIYAISNIHNITWGSRPEVKDKKSESKFNMIEKKLEIDYKNFRSNFLIFWLVLNLLIGNSVTYVSRENNEFIILCLAYFIFAIIAFKIFFSSLYTVRQWWRLWCFKKNKSNPKDVSLKSIRWISTNPRPDFESLFFTCGERFY